MQVTAASTSRAAAKDRAAAAREAIEQHLIAAADIAFRLGCGQFGRDIAALSEYIPAMVASTDELAVLARIAGH
ncbi:MAG TPA: hypothetical protein VMK13_13540 [Streptosporangiaceae bacterium]|nr:hypothetical protein [Streptosporangiaceae bacterium]